MIDTRDGLKIAISRSGLKQAYIADQAGLTGQQLSDILHKRRRLDANEFFTLCEIIKCTPNCVFSMSARSESA